MQARNKDTRSYAGTQQQQGISYFAAFFLILCHNFACRISNVAMHKQNIFCEWCIIRAPTVIPWKYVCLLAHIGCSGFWHVYTCTFLDCGSCSCTHTGEKRLSWLNPVTFLCLANHILFETCIGARGQHLFPLNCAWAWPASGFPQVLNVWPLWVLCGIPCNLCLQALVWNTPVSNGTTPASLGRSSIHSSFESCDVSGQ